MEVKIVVEKFLGTQEALASANLALSLFKTCGLPIPASTYTCEQQGGEVEVFRNY